MSSKNISNIPVFINSESFSTKGNYPKFLTKNEELVYGELDREEWRIYKHIQKAYPSLLVQSINNALRRMEARGIVESRGNKEEKMKEWRIKS